MAVDANKEQEEEQDCNFTGAKLQISLNINLNRV
jgi:hypothetical protein